MGEHEGMLARDGIRKCLIGQKKDTLFRDQGATGWSHDHQLHIL